MILIGGRRKALLQVSAAGGQPTPATELGANETTHDYPDFFPDGRHFSTWLAMEESWRTGTSLSGASIRKSGGCCRDHAGASYSPTGHLLFVRDTTLMAQPFDLERLEISGDATPVAERVWVGPRTPFSISTNGTLAYLDEPLRPESRLAWFDRTGREGAAVAPMGDYGTEVSGPARLSPDGSRSRSLAATGWTRTSSFLTLRRAQPAGSHPRWGPTSHRYGRRMDALASPRVAMVRATWLPTTLPGRTSTRARWASWAKTRCY